MTSARTEVVGVIGDPVRHSLSPAMHNAAFEACGLDWIFVAFEVPRGDGAAAALAMRTLRLRGLSVTMPHKEDVIGACDELSPSAAMLRSVNHLRLVDGRIVGDSTDGDGFLRSLADAEVDPSGRRALVLGAGGAARAVAVALAGAGATVACAARRAEAAADLARLCGGDGLGLDQVGSVVGRYDLVVNATPVGMGESADSPLPAGVLADNQVVADLVYHPLETPLLRQARVAGARTVDGLGMLVHQAAIQFEHWTGLAAPVDAMRAGARAELSGR